MSQHLFRFTVEALTTKETVEFLGQGQTIEDALKDGKQNCKSVFRPKIGANTNQELGFLVALPDGRRVRRTVMEFESCVPFDKTLTIAGESID